MGGMTEASEVRGKNPAEKDEPDSDQAHPKNRVDHRPNNGPLLELLWSEEEPLMGQTLYLGAEFGVDGKIYCLPGHGKSDLVGSLLIDTTKPLSYGTIARFVSPMDCVCSASSASDRSRNR